jgi:hypothetical protein
MAPVKVADASFRKALVTFGTFEETEWSTPSPQRGRGDGLAQ